MLLGSCRVSLHSAVQLDFSLDGRLPDICPDVLISIFVGSPNILPPPQPASPRRLSAFTPSALTACLPASASKNFPSFCHALAHQVLIISIAIIRFPPVKLVAVNTSVATAEMGTALVLSHVPSDVLSYSICQRLLVLFHHATLCIYPLDFSALSTL